jgi:ubiquinone/menaquinone biosynthesis C-methylase UbiE
MSEFSKTWDKQHLKSYRNEDWIDKPSIFARWAVKYFPEKGELLDLGAGQGQDSRLFASLGYKVISTDFSEEALKINEEKSKSMGITVQKLDLSQSFPYRDFSFDIVYAHLSLHYFDKVLTQKVFDGIYRVLKRKGILALVVNSTSDPEYGSGEELERGFFKIGAVTKRYFSIKTLSNFVRKFEAIVLDDGGETYKDKAKGVSNLIRFAGKKSI